MIVTKIIIIKWQNVFRPFLSKRTSTSTSSSHAPSSSSIDFSFSFLRAKLRRKSEDMRAVIEKGLRVLGEHDQVTLPSALYLLILERSRGRSDWDLLPGACQEDKRIRWLLLQPTHLRFWEGRGGQNGAIDWPCDWVRIVHFTNHARFTKNANQELPRMLALR